MLSLVAKDRREKRNQQALVVKVEQNSISPEPWSKSYSASLGLRTSRGNSPCHQSSSSLSLALSLSLSLSLSLALILRSRMHEDVHKQLAARPKCCRDSLEQDVVVLHVSQQRSAASQGKHKGIRLQMIPRMKLGMLHMQNRIYRTTCVRSSPSSPRTRLDRSLLLQAAPSSGQGEPHPPTGLSTRRR